MTLKGHLLGSADEAIALKPIERDPISAKDVKKLKIQLRRTILTYQKKTTNVFEKIGRRLQKHDYKTLKQR